MIIVGPKPAAVKPTKGASHVPRPTPDELHAIVDRYVATLVNPRIPLAQRTLAEEAVVTLLGGSRSPWGGLWFASILWQIIATLPTSDPWRHMAGNNGVQRHVVHDIDAPHGCRGAWTAQGRFGSVRDAVDLIRIDHPGDLHRDARLSSYAAVLPAHAAYLIAAAGFSFGHLDAAVRHLLNAIDPDHRVEDARTVHLFLDAALRWALDRRAAYTGEDGYIVHASAIAVARAHRAVFDIEPTDPDFEIHAAWAGKIDDDAYEAVRDATALVD
jgi:hypothetical protein